MANLGDLMFYSPFKSDVYRSIWIATLFSNIGTWVHTVTSSLLMTKLTTSSTLIALVQTAAILPIFLFSIPAGIIADLYNRRTIVICAQIIMAILAFSMAILTYMGDMTDILLLVMTFILNIGLAFNQPAWQALSSTLIPQEEIKQAAALNNLSFNFARCIGPAIAGYYFASFGPSYLYILNAISFLGVIIAFYFKGTSDIAAKQSLSLNTFLIGFSESIQFFRQFSTLKFIVIKAFLYFLLASCLWALLPYIIVVYYHLLDKDLGVLMSAAGIGAMLNAFFLPYIRKYFNDSQLTTTALLLAGLIMLVFIHINSMYLWFILLLIFGGSWSLAVSVFNGVLQAEFPKHTRSRLIGMYCVFFALGQALGSYLSGKATQLWGVETTLFNIALITLFIGSTYLFLNNNKRIFKLLYLLRNR